jgi:hypothetical protein
MHFVLQHTGCAFDSFCAILTNVSGWSWSASIARFARRARWSLRSWLSRSARHAKHAIWSNVPLRTCKQGCYLENKSPTFFPGIPFAPGGPGSPGGHFLHPSGLGDTISYFPGSPFSPAKPGMPGAPSSPGLPVGPTGPGGHRCCPSHWQLLATGGGLTTGVLPP